jgi:hypothetical protein
VGSTQIGLAGCQLLKYPKITNPAIIAINKGINFKKVNI